MVSGVLRKGAWTEEEDSLLRKCIEKYGEGKWHQIPLRAGLNRCRKSCRLRWLNYLQPNIKRGNFSLDEVDLIIRLHKLLGNRWSLIAGRLPGRTANDVKNYWNTHQVRKSISKHHPHFIPLFKQTQPTCIPKTQVLKPRPRTFNRPNVSASSFQSKAENSAPIVVTPKNNKDESINRMPLIENVSNEAFSSSQAIENSAMELFKDLIENDEKQARGSWPSVEDEEAINRFWSEEIPTFFQESNNGNDFDSNNKDKEKSLIWDNDVNHESAIDMDIWDLLGYTQDHV